ncbi:MAG: peptidase M16 [Rhodobacterales bacterium]|nr:MAG: peptidase M16 [Rhodobacterales bacterium]
MPGLESASLGLWVSAGARHETAAENGIAHFLEHMAFKGTTTRSALKIAEEIEDVGGYLNAYTSRETTAYYARVLKRDVGLALDVISDIVLNPIFDPAEIEVERGVILQEIGQSLDTPDDIVFDWLQEAAYPDQPMGRTILGPAERVRAFGREDLAGFVARQYTPERMILSAAGAVDHAEILRFAERVFGALPGGGARDEVPARFVGGEKRMNKALEQVHFTLGFKAPSYRDEAIYTAQVYAGVMGGGMSSRLFQEVREKRGLCYSIYTQAGAYSDTGLLTLYAGTSGEDLAALTQVAGEELRRAGDTIRAEEVARAKAQMKAGLLMGMEGASARAERLARQVAIFGRVLPVDETVERIDAVSLPEVRGFAHYLMTHAPAMAVYGPVGDVPALDGLRDDLVA